MIGFEGFGCWLLGCPSGGDDDFDGGGDTGA